MSVPIRHFLDLWPEPADLRAILDDARVRKASARLAKGRPTTTVRDGAPCDDLREELTRTRSFDAACPAGRRRDHLQRRRHADRRGAHRDTAGAGRMVDALMIAQRPREVERSPLVRVPVINGLTDRSHPCRSWPTC